jgi:hypothetical protein
MTAARSTSYAGVALFRTGWINAASLPSVQTPPPWPATLQHVSDRLDAGEAVSGPAAPRLISAAQAAAASDASMYARSLGDMEDSSVQVHLARRAPAASSPSP